MIKLLTFLLMFGATQAFASPHLLADAPTDDLELLVQAGSSELVLNALFVEAGEEWGISTQTIWSEYRYHLVKVRKLGVDPATNDPVYELTRVKTGGSLVLILDIDAL